VICPDQFHAACTGGAADHEACEGIVLPAVQRMRDSVFYLRNCSSCSSAVGARPFVLAIRLNSSAVSPLQHGVEESFTLTISSKAAPAGTTADGAAAAGGGTTTEATLTASNQWGVLHGLQILGQLIVASDNYTYYHLNLNSTQHLPLHIEDGPRVAWRSLLIDTARHYLSPALLKRTVDTMAASHLNVLHWHATDDASFPICLDDSLPGTCEAQSYRDPWGTPLVYSKAWLRDFIAYANARGVRIMLELDLPAHSMSLWRARPDLFVTDCPASNWSSHPSARFPNEEQPLPDVSNPGWWALLKGMVDEIATIFPEAYFHGGADEVNPACWYVLS
jgi:hexosaminidase